VDGIRCFWVGIAAVVVEEVDGESSSGKPCATQFQYRNYSFGASRANLGATGLECTE